MSEEVFSCEIYTLLTHSSVYLVDMSKLFSKEKPLQSIRQVK